MSKNHSNRKVLVPLATMLVAGAVAVGSGATFTSESVHTIAVTSGSLSHSNSGPTMSVDNMKPGDVRTGQLTITNDGDLDSTLTLQETSDSSEFVPGDLKLVISQPGRETPLYNGNFGELDNSVKLDLGALNVKGTATVTFEVSMPATAGNGSQGKSASASYQYVTTQTP